MVKRAVASKWVKTSYFFICEMLSLGSGCSYVKRLWACEQGKSLKHRGYACIIDIHLLTLSKLWGRFPQLQNRFNKKNRTQSVFMLQRWIAYQNIAERIKNKSSALDFSFSALFFFNMDLKSKNGRKTTNFSIFLLKGSWKKNSDLI